ncbi:MAG: hypothetical protein ACI379_15600 [Nocardioides sp.]|uniref:hypothetical protein n=1 Tax=Nocardioides sp. TaxID=35761 RepID=UPI003F110788
MRTSRVVLAAALCALPVVALAPAEARTGPATTVLGAEELERYVGAEATNVTPGKLDDPTPVEEGVYLTEMPKGDASGGTDRALLYEMKDPRATLRVTIVTLRASGGWLSLQTEEERYCGLSVNSMQFGQLLTGMAATTEGSTTCADQDSFLIILQNYADEKLPMRIQIAEEPVETDPGWGEAIRMPTGSPATTDPVRVKGGASLDDLPLLESGSYSLTLGPSTQQWFSFPLTYGEGLNVEAVFTATESGDRIVVPPYGAVEVYDPMMLGYAATDGREMLSADESTTIPVKVPALGSSTVDDLRDIGPHLPGVYRIAVSLEEFEGEDVDVQLNVERFGDPEAGPTYKGGDWSYEETVGLTYTGSDDPMARDDDPGSTDPSDEPTTDAGTDGDADAVGASDEALGTRQLAGGLSAVTGVALVAAGGVLLAKRRRTA